MKIVKLKTWLTVRLAGVATPRPLRGLMQTASASQPVLVWGVSRLLEVIQYML